MNYHFLLKHKLINIFQSLALFVLLAGLIFYVALIVGGETLAFYAFFAVVLLFIGNPYLSSQFILRMYKAQPIPHSSAPDLYHLVEQLSKRAKLPVTPQLYYIPSSVINAFTVGKKDNPVVAISDGVLQNLSYQEMAGVLGHEIAHLQNDDIRVMTFADIAGRILKILSFMGQMLILISLPIAILSEVTINWIPFLIITFAPVVSDLIQLSLSRIREYEADIGSAMLLGDARPLASALAKIDDYEHNYLKSVFSPVPKIPEPSILRTHPETEERIKRLMELQPSITQEPLGHKQELLQGKIPHHFIETRHTKPRRHLNGFWY